MQRIVILGLALSATVWFRSAGKVLVWGKR